MKPSSGIRPTRGRPSKVTKPTTPARNRTARHLPGSGGHDHSSHFDVNVTKAEPQQDTTTANALAAAQALQATTGTGTTGPDDPGSHTGHTHTHSHQHTHHSVFDDPRMGAEDYAAAAAAVAMETGLAAADGQAEAEADADMEDDDPSAATSQMPPQMDLTAANILANGGANPMAPATQDQQQDLQQVHQHQPPAQMGGPQQMQPSHHSMDPSLVKTTEEFAHESGYGQLNVESALAKRLAREPGHRHAQQRRPEQVLNLARRSNVEALFAHIAGEPARVPCKNCHKGHGPWTSCIVVDGQMCGSCANCWFNASGARCSFHETRNPQVMPQHSSMLPPGTAGLPADPSYRFTTPHALVTGHGAAVAGMGNVGHSGLMTGNPMFQHIVNKAMGEVRGVDKATRQLMLIETTAKQLALQIAEYEDIVASQEPGHSQQGMGDEPGGGA